MDLYFYLWGAVCVYTRDTNPVELPSHFRRRDGTVAVSPVAHNMAKYTKREVHAVVLAKQPRKLMGPMSSRDVFILAQTRHERGLHS